MFFKKDFEQQIELNEKKLLDLEAQNELLQQEVQKLYAELKLTPDQLNAFVSNSANFSAEDWQEIQNQRQQMDDKLQLDLGNINNPLKTKKAYSTRRVESNWLFVR